MEDITINTLTEYTKLIEETCIDQKKVLFRGQTEEWPLLPALARERLTGNDILDTEKIILEEFQRHCVPYIRVKPETIWDWLALARHYGLPTRLLDWSLNPFIALWFAVSRSPSGNKSGILWILTPDEQDSPLDTDMNNLECKRNMVFTPIDVSERITAQVAWFTVHKCWSRKKKFEPLEEDIIFKNKLIKLEIPAGRFAHLRYHLNTFDVHNASVYPGLDGLCSHIKWQNCFLDDEGEK
jgi:hypothetical protein